MNKEIFAIYFPSWHPDKHYEQWYGKGFSEWELLKTTKPLFAGHRQPKKPLWGYFDESDPVWMKKQIDTAADHGLSGFIFDWYWYQGEQFLEKPLNEAFLNAPNGKRLKFALMWANHDWGKWPALEDKMGKMYGNENQGNTIFLRCLHTLDDCRRAVEFCCENYFHRENYWKIGKKPVFSFYNINKLLADFGSIENVAEALEVMAETARAYGFDGIHFLANIGCCDDNVYCCGWGRVPQAEAIGFAAVFAYNIVRSKDFDKIPEEMPVYDFSEMMESHEYCWNRIEENGLPHYPSVTTGLDVSPRWSRKARFPMKFREMSYEPIIRNNTPERFGELMQKALARDSGIVIINAWNEWSEGMYLLPEEEYGYAYLEEIKKQIDKENEQ